MPVQRHVYPYSFSHEALLFRETVKFTSAFAGSNAAADKALPFSSELACLPDNPDDKRMGVGNWGTSSLVTMLAGVTSVRKVHLEVLLCS